MVSGIRLHRSTVAALLLGLGLAAPASAEPGDIKGQDVMGDKSRSAIGGWSQAPVPREESAAKDAPNPGGESEGDKASAPGAREGSGNSSALNNGADDPQKPLEQRAPGPSGSNPAAPTR